MITFLLVTLIITLCLISIGCLWLFHKEIYKQRKQTIKWCKQYPSSGILQLQKPYLERQHISKKSQLKITWIGLLLLSIGLVTARGMTLQDGSHVFDREEHQIRVGILPPVHSVRPIDGTKAVVEFHNDTPYAMHLKFHGSRDYTLTVQPCPTCKVYFPGELKSTYCPENLPTGILSLPPATYEVEMRSAGTPKILKGKRTLHKGHKYIDCWHLVHGKL